MKIKRSWRMIPLILALALLCACSAAPGGESASTADGEAQTVEDGGDTASDGGSAGKDTGDANAAASAEELTELFRNCTGYQGSAGAGLRSAQAARVLLDFAVERNLSQADPDLLREAVLEGYTALNDEERVEFDGNFAGSVSPLVEEALADFDSVRDAFADAGEDEAMEALVNTPDAWEDWNALRSFVFIMGNEIS